MNVKLIHSVAIKGKRTDLCALRDDIKAGANLTNLIGDDGRLPAIARYGKFAMECAKAFSKVRSKEFREVETFVYWGEGGTGKTKKALYGDNGNRLPDVYLVPKTENFKWWDGYEGEKTVVFDDFYGGMKWTKFLSITDGHQMLLEVKGGHIYAEWTKIIFTSNVHPDTWYTDHSTEDKEFNRRFKASRIIHLLNSI